MANPWGAGNLPAMYTINDHTRHVRDAAAPYGGGWQEREVFPAEGVLRDLCAAAAEGETRRIVARYCVIRFVLLRETGEAPELVRHARTAALEHLRQVEDGLEVEEMRRLAECPEPAESVTAGLAAVAARAESAGHVNGAFAAWRAAYAVARRREPGHAAELAGSIALFLRRRGGAGQARAWEARARMLGRPDAGSAPPSAP